MIIALWMMYATDANSGAVYVGNFGTMDACEQSAKQARQVGPTPYPNVSFVCVQAK